MNLRVEEAKEKECELTLDTPYSRIKTNTYMAFLKTGERNHIEINNLNLDDIEEFQKVLAKIIDDNRKKIEKGLFD